MRFYYNVLIVLLIGKELTLSRLIILTIIELLAFPRKNTLFILSFDISVAWTFNRFLASGELLKLNLGHGSPLGKCFCNNREEPHYSLNL